MREPPQMCTPLWCRLTCHGQRPGCASEPPTILAEDSGRPQSAAGYREVISRPCPPPPRPRELRTKFRSSPHSRLPP